MADRDTPTVGEYVERTEHDYFAATSMAQAIVRATELTEDDGRTRWVFVVDDGEDGDRKTIAFVAAKEYGLRPMKWATWLRREYAGGGWETVAMPIEIRPGHGLMIRSGKEYAGDDEADGDGFGWLSRMDWGEDHS